MKFTVEFGDERNGSILIKTLKMRVRGHYSTSKLKRAHNVGEKMAAMPDIPGVSMHVDTDRKLVSLFDPLEEKPELLKTINGIADRAVSIRPSGQELAHVPKSEHPMTDDLMKTMILELLAKKKENCLRVVSGQLPSPAIVEKMSGRQLNYTTSARAPKYKDEVEDYEAKLERQSI